MFLPRSFSPVLKALNFSPVYTFSRRLHNLFRKETDPHHHHHHHHIDPKSIKPGITGDHHHEYDEEFIKSYQKLIEGNHNFVQERIEKDQSQRSIKHHGKQKRKQKAM